MEDPEKILKGEVNYSLEDFYLELRDKWINTVFKKDMTDQQKKEAFKSLFMFILLSSEDKPLSVMKEVYKDMPEENIKNGQEAFKKEINVARHIQMKKYLDFYQEYMGGMGMTLKLLNIWIQDFLSKYIKEENKNGTA